MDTPEFGAVQAEIGRLAREMHSSVDGKISPDDVLLEVTELSVRLLPGVDHAGVTLVEGRKKKVRSTAATGPVPAFVDSLQERLHQGPCLDVIWEHHTVRVNDYASEQRWPDFATAVLAETPVRSSMSLQLYTDESELGALNLFSEHPDTFTPAIEEPAFALATHGAVGLACARSRRQLQSALASRDMIGQAKGMIMERYRMNAVAAFKLLVKLSQDSNTPLAEVAKQLVYAEFPPD